MEENKSVDLRLPDADMPSISVDAIEVPKQSYLWAEISKPFAIFVFILIAIVIIFPFLGIIIWPGGNREHFHEVIIDWGKTILAPVVGLASAVATYYFGVGSTTKNDVNK